jgi:tRNA A-37 threonylcarbamoyl transferase component Bud32
MQYVDNSSQLKEVLRLIYLNNHTNYKSLIEKIYTQMGENLARLHNSNIIHGDLTTSNMLLKIK